ncbi:Heterokaryon incompatibility protein (HET) domain containing protein [Naviculisporaceae sp. PSN 640]
MMCQLCLDIQRSKDDSSYDDYYGLTKTILSVIEAAKLGCRLCSMILRSVDYFGRKRGYADPLEDSNLRCIFRVPRDTEHKSLLVELWDYPDWRAETFVVEFFAVSSLPDPWGLIQPAPPIAKDSSAPECFARIRSWIEDCDTTHEKCQKNAVLPPLPTRVVDVNPSEDGQLRPFLFTSCGAVGKYAALSYVWGGDQPVKATRATLKAFESEIPWASLPRTLQDAMTIAHKLDIRYIWIDALTIVQDDESDWEREAGKMASVYGNAYITIAATASYGFWDGILKSRGELADIVLVEKVDLVHGAMQPRVVDSLSEGEIYARELFEDNIKNQPLEKRGWALQEYLLSRRSIQYGVRELVWECRTGHALESRPSFSPGPPTRSSSSSRETYMNDIQPIYPLFLPPQTATASSSVIDSLSGLWFKLVSNFSERSLTREMDKLPALSGLAHAFQACGMELYYAGLWESDLLRGLLWVANHEFPPASRKFDGRPPHYRPRQYRAPSWSWASVEGPIAWAYGVGFVELKYLVARVNTVSNKEIVLTGKVACARLERNSTLFPVSHSSEGTDISRHLKGEVQWKSSSYTVKGGSILVSAKSGLTGVRTQHIVRIKTDIADIQPMSYQENNITTPRGLCKAPLDGVICIQIYERDGRTIALALVPVEDGGSTSVKYRRVGIIKYAWDFFEDSEVREVTIVQDARYVFHFALPAPSLCLIQESLLPILSKHFLSRYWLNTYMRIRVVYRYHLMHPPHSAVRSGVLDSSIADWFTQARLRIPLARYSIISVKIGNIRGQLEKNFTYLSLFPNIGSGMSHRLLYICHVGGW